MIAFISACLANLMPAVTGTLALLCLLHRPLNRHVLGLTLGMGYFLGVAMVVSIGELGRWIVGPETTLLTCLVLLIGACAAGYVLWRQPRRVENVSHKPTAVWPTVIWLALFLLLLINGYLTMSEALTRPVYPWDAWSAWLVKPLVWYALGADVDFVSFGNWLASTDVRVYTNEAWHYPELLPRFQLWVLHWVGHWHEQLVLLSSTFAYVAMLAVIYHLLRLLGTSAVSAMAVCFIVGAIPILNVQVALPGLVDIWVAAEMVVFCACLMLWVEWRQRRWLLTASIMLLMIAATKLEGLVWASLGIPVMVYASASIRLRYFFSALVPVVVFFWWVMDGIRWQVGENLHIVLTPQEINLPYLGYFRLEFSNQLKAFVHSFHNLPNWHLTWYLLLPITLWMVIVFRRHRLGRGLAAFAGVATAALFFLFFMTNAGIWAASMTASNRLALHFVPAWILWLGLLVVRFLDEGETYKPIVIRS